MDSELELAAARMESKLIATGVSGVDIGTLIELLPALIQLFQACKRPVPPNPNPSATAAEQKAYELKYTAVEGYDEETADYERHLLHRTAVRCKKQKKKGGNPISRSEAVDIARAALDEARVNDIATIAKGIEEAKAV